MESFCSGGQDFRVTGSRGAFCLEENAPDIEAERINNEAIHS